MLIQTVGHAPQILPFAHNAALPKASPQMVLANLVSTLTAYFAILITQFAQPVYLTMDSMVSVCVGRVHRRTAPIVILTTVFVFNVVASMGLFLVALAPVHPVLIVTVGTVILIILFVYNVYHIMDL